MQGASRGLGLEMARQLVEKGYKVVATCRNPDSSEGLQALGAAYPGRVLPARLDVTESDTIGAVAAMIEADESFEGAIDVVINSTGILHEGSQDRSPERQIAEIDRDWMLQSFNVNTVGPLLVVQALLPFLRRNRKSERGLAVVANLSARVGSIGDNKTGGWYSYRMSKSALNMATRNLSHELKRHNVCAVALHPGTVDTDLTKPYQKGIKADKLFPVERGAAQIIDIIEGVSLNDGGKFFAWDGSEIPY